MQTVFPYPQDAFRLVRVDRHDARSRSDDFLSLRNLILQNSDAYPAIGKWMDGKVVEGLTSGLRVGFVGMLNDVPVASAVLRKGGNSKFCHLKIAPHARSKHLGDLFFTLMALEVRHVAASVRFTLPESLWEEKQKFFRSFSFAKARASARQYRLFDEELFCETPFVDLFASVRNKLPRIFGEMSFGGHSLLSGAVLALKENALEKVLSGVKKVVVRSQFSMDREGQRISLCTTSAAPALLGEARISRVIAGTSKQIWELFGHVMGCSRTDYDSEVGEKDKVFAITLSDVQAFPEKVPLSQLGHLLGIDLPPPRSYLSLAGNDSWLSAVALSAALQGTIRTSAIPPPQLTHGNATFPDRAR
jgi:predicted transcriptional regulator